jgi:Domain of unknown function (DUF4180)
MSASMADVVTSIHDETVLVCGPDGPTISDERDALDIIGEAFGHRVRIVVVPASRLDPEFFNLSSRIAGDIIQKFVNYRLHLVIIGDISRELTASESLQAFVRESNSGSHVWFLGDLVQLDARLTPRPGAIQGAN